jgi:hypothetical protein
MSACDTKEKDWKTPSIYCQCDDCACSVLERPAALCALCWPRVTGTKTVALPLCQGERLLWGVGTCGHVRHEHSGHRPPREHTRVAGESLNPSCMLGGVFVCCRLTCPPCPRYVRVRSSQTPTGSRQKQQRRRGHRPSSWSTGSATGGSWPSLL